MHLWPLFAAEGSAKVVDLAYVAGPGVGLYMVKHMLENAGSTSMVQSEPDVGSTFTVPFPT